MKEGVYDEMCVEEKMEWLQKEVCCNLWRLFWSCLDFGL